MPASTYKPENVALVRELAERGATLHEVGEFFEVDRGTIRRWRQAHPEFDAALRVGKAFADERVKHSLYSRAVGYRYVEQQAIKVKVSQYEETVEVVDVERELPPDTVACIFWLKNRLPKEWRDKVDHGVEADASLVQVLAAVRGNGSTE